jgi:hypothetical protein
MSTNTVVLFSKFLRRFHISYGNCERSMLLHVGKKFDSLFQIVELVPHLLREGSAHFFAAI